ncbi:MAG: zf-HC2 domain-containing protein [Clostridiaceae bacterium]
MNKINCTVIKDILPLYADDIVSEDTKKLVEEHLLSCNDCKKELSLLKSDLETPKVIITEKDDIAFLKKLSLDIKKKRVFTAMLAATISAIVVILSFAYLTAPEYIPYTQSPEIITANEKNGSVTLSFIGEYELTQREPGSYDISIYNTVWNEIIGVTKFQTITVNPNNEKVNTIYYVSNARGQEDKVIYGRNPIDNGGVMTLPRLFLNYYIKLDLLITFVLGGFYLIFRKKEKVKDIIAKILFVPISYFVSHVMITGLNATSFFATRDFYLILLLVMPIYSLFYILYKKKHSKVRY